MNKNFWLSLLILISVLPMNLHKVTSTGLDVSRHRQSDDAPEYDKRFFFDGFSEGCFKYCWYGMVMGEASETEFLQFLQDSPGQNLQHSTPENLERYGQWSASNTYFLDDEENVSNINEVAYITIVGYIADDSLQGMSIYVDGFAISDISPKAVIESSGTPSAISLATFEDYAKLWLIYEEQGLYFEYGIEFASEIPIETYTICFDPSSWLQMGLTQNAIGIVLPEQADTELLGIWSDSLYERSFPIEEAVGLSIEEFSKFVLDSKEPCLQINEDALLYR
jgi:hypothetical protein